MSYLKQTSPQTLLADPTEVGGLGRSSETYACIKNNSSAEVREWINNFLKEFPLSEKAEKGKGRQFQITEEREEKKRKRCLRDGVVREKKKRKVGEEKEEKEEVNLRDQISTLTQKQLRFFPLFLFASLINFFNSGMRN